MENWEPAAVVQFLSPAADFHFTGRLRPRRFFHINTALTMYLLFFSQSSQQTCIPDSNIMFSFVCLKITFISSTTFLLQIFLPESLHPFGRVSTADTVAPVLDPPVSARSLSLSACLSATVFAWPLPVPCARQALCVPAQKRDWGSWDRIKSRKAGLAAASLPSVENFSCLCDLINCLPGIFPL